MYTKIEFSKSEILSPGLPQPVGAGVVGQSWSRNFHPALAPTLQYFKYFVFTGPDYDYDCDYDNDDYDNDNYDNDNYDNDNYDNDNYDYDDYDQCCGSGLLLTGSGSNLMVQIWLRIQIVNNRQ